jgi:glycine cleavage system regulatory protein
MWLNLRSTLSRPEFATMPALVVTLVGPDRPGLVGQVSDVIRRNGGNWLESRMSHLADQFAGIVLVDVGAADTEQLIDALQSLTASGLKIVAQVDSSAIDAVPATGPVRTFSVVGNDRPGIVREVTQVLAELNVNVEEFRTECKDAPHSGGRIFRADASVRLPLGLNVDTLQDQVEQIAPDLMIDFVVDSP